MFKIIEFFRLISIGFGLKKAITHNHVKIRDWEWFALILVLFLVIVEAYKYQQFFKERIIANKENLVKQSVNEIKELKLSIQQKESKIATLENTFISCLNKKGVIVSGRSMNCIIKDYY